MDKKLYLECYSGISGDMTVAALLDLGADEKVLMDVLNSLPLSGYHVNISRVLKSGIDACDFDVVLENQDNHDHDMEYLYGHLHGKHIDGHEHDHHHEHHHDGDHVHEHEHHHGEALASEHEHHHGEALASEHEHHHGEPHTHEHEHHHDGDHEHDHHHEHHHDEAHTHEHEHYHDAAHTHEHEDHHDEAHTHEHEHYHDAAHTHEHEDYHDEAHTHEHHHHHEHRGMKEITEIISKGTMTDGARKLALKIFDILAHAESKAHNVPVEQVHFHEVGAVDSIVDIVAIAVCLDNLGIKECVVTHLTEGKGTVRCQHGILPVPVPAVLHIVTDNHLPIEITDIAGELVTPTGAATVAAICTSHELPKTFTVEKTGMGAGKRQYECAGILRAMIIS